MFEALMFSLIFAFLCCAIFAFRFFHKQETSKVLHTLLEPRGSEFTSIEVPIVTKPSYVLAKPTKQKGN